MHSMFPSLTDMFMSNLANLSRSQKIQYAKSKSDIIAKLDGTFRGTADGTATGKVEVTELQQSIFNAPVPGLAPAAAAATSLALPAKPQAPAGAADSRGQKRTRDEEEEDDDDDSDVAMEEDSDDD